MNANPTPAYLLAQIDVKDHDAYMQRYGMPASAILQKYGAEVLVASANSRAVEGETKSNWTVVIRFPSLAIAEAFYNSSEYQPLKALRVGELTSDGAVSIVEGFDVAAFGAAS